MELIFKTKSGAELYQDLDHTFISTNPCEVLACIKEDIESSSLMDRIMAQSLLEAIAESQHGIFFDPKGPKNILTDKKGCFLVVDIEGNSMFGMSNPIRIEKLAVEKLKFPMQVIV